MEDDLIKNGRRPQNKWKTTSKINGRQPQKKWKMTSNKLKMEDTTSTIKKRDYNENPVLIMLLYFALAPTLDGQSLALFSIFQFGLSFAKQGRG